MAWQEYEYAYGDEVVLPNGQHGRVQVVGDNGTAQVNVNGQLIEVKASELKKIERKLDELFRDEDDKKAEVKGGDAKEGEEVKQEFKIGDKVQHAKDANKTGTVMDVTQRTVKVQWDDGGRTNYEKRNAGSYLKHAQGKEDKPEEKKQEEQTPEQENKESKSTADSLYGILQLQKHLEEKIDGAVDEEMQELRDLAKKRQELEVKVGDKVNVVKGARHRQLETLITYAGLRLNSLLVGMAGTGKTFAAEQASEALGVPFYAMSVGAQTSKSDIIGYTDANGNYVRTHFRDAYEKGGVFLMDEIDAGNANVLIQVNAALANGYMSFPDAMVRKHQDFVFIASANTYGNGASRQYVGRNQLDAATLDRFAVIDWLIDDELESQLATGKYGKAWYTAVRASRDFVKDKSIRALISPRATQKGSALLAAGVNVDEVISSVLLSSVPEDKKPDVIQVAVTVFNKHASGVKGEIAEDIEKANEKLTEEVLPF